MSDTHKHIMFFCQAEKSFITHKPAEPEPDHTGGGIEDSYKILHFKDKYRDKMQRLKEYQTDLRAQLNS